MDKVVPFLKYFTTIFYLKILEFGRVLFGSVEVCIDLKLFKTV
jgi:hypothetical protein